LFQFQSLSYYYGHHQKTLNQQQHNPILQCATKRIRKYLSYLQDYHLNLVVTIIVSHHLTWFNISRFTYINIQ